MITRTRATTSTHDQCALKSGVLAAQAPLFDNVQVGGASMTFERNAEIFGESESADYVYKVLSGSVRAYKVLSDGRRQVTAFYLPGDEVANEPQLQREQREDDQAANRQNGPLQRQHDPPQNPP